MMIKVFKIYLILMLFLLAFQGNTQDIHFSQFNSSPLNLNPALAGGFNGAYRFVINERRQWGAISRPIPYQTFGISADASNFLRANGLGAAISIYNDRAGDSQFGTTQVNLAGSYSIRLNKDSSQFVSVGIQSGFTQRSINYSNLSFDDEYNGYKYVPNSGLPENFANSGRVYPNLNVGVNWLYDIKERTGTSLGAALFNINTPDQSFFNGSGIKLDRRLTVHAGARFRISEKLDGLPSVLYMQQGKFSELDLGGSIKYILEDQPYHYRAVYLGAWTRAKDAGWLTLGLDYDNWYAGISYDFNYSKLTPASNGLGGVEISLIYIIRSLPPKKVSYKACPNYI